MTAASTIRRTPSQHDGDYTKAAYREDLVRLFGLLRRRGLSAAEIARELRRGPIPVIEGPAPQLADDIVLLQQRVADDARRGGVR
jgi:hypothetical protein